MASNKVVYLREQKAFVCKAEEEELIALYLQYHADYLRIKQKYGTQVETELPVPVTQSLFQ